MPQLSPEKSRTKEHYNQLDDFEAKSDSYYFKRRAEELTAFFGSARSDTAILNLGAGNGRFSRFLSSRGFSNIVDTDISILLLKQSPCRKRVLADAENLPFKKDAFDSVIMTDVIEHLENRKNVLAELFGVLGKKARVFITYPNPFWVPMLNLFGRLGIKVDARDGKVSRKVFEGEAQRFFEVDSLKTVMLAAKLPAKALSAFERIEARLSPKFMNRFGFMHVYVIRKR